MKIWLFCTILVLSLPVAAFQSTPGERIHLKLGDTKITENGEPVIEFSGECGGGEVLAFHLPQKGWFVCSVRPFAGFDFQRIGKLDGNRIAFSLDNRKYEIISDQPISAQHQSLDLWVARITPPADKSHAESKLISCSSDFEYWLRTTLKEEKR